jgi:penicillin-binding protein 2
LSSTTGARPPLRRLRRTEFLPPDERVEIPYRFTPKLALRVGILGVLALAVFAVLLFRLWALQVLSGTQYLVEAQNNQIRTVRIEAPRGTVVDKQGRPLVTNVPGTIVRVWPQDLPKTWARQLGELRRLAGVLNMSPRTIVGLLKGHMSDPLTPVTIKSGVHRAQAAYILEHQDEFRGVDVHSTTLRHYPHLALGAHILGHVGEISAEQLKEKPYRSGDYRPGDRIGQGGVEGVYDRYLRGKAGLAQLRVDASGRPRGVFKPRQQPQPGDTLRLTIDLQLQQAAERAIRDGIELAHQNGDCYGCWSSNGGAIVAIDPRNGAIRALASYPTYKPSVYVGRVHVKKLNAEGLTPKTAKKQNFPALDRAISGLYPAGSTFKVITALAAMQEHIISPYDTLQCTSVYYVRDAAGRPVLGGTFKNWDPNVNQPMDLGSAIEASCDTYFYQLGYDFFNLPKERGHPLQAWAARFGIGKRTGIDIPGEERGLLPTPEWRQRTFTRKTDRCCWQVDRIWKPGNSIQLAIGQGDLQLTPLQMARVYAVIANGGKLVTPHLAGDVEQITNDNQPVVKWRFPVGHPQPVGVDPTALAAVQDGLLRATHGDNGTSTAVFGQFPYSIAGKTGTAEKVVTLPRVGPSVVDQSWWCGYGPVEDPELVVCALIENGGHGGTAAAPAALQVFQQFFHVKSAQYALPGSTD